MRVDRVLLLLAVFLAILCRPTAAETVVEAWRSDFAAFTNISSVSVNSVDGSCWADSGGMAVHLAADGSEIARAGSLDYVRAVSVDPADGSCWAVGSSATHDVEHIAPDGTVLWAGGRMADPCSVSANQSDGSVWIGSHGYEVVHLAADGTVLFRGGGVSGWLSVSANASDGSCWVGDWDDRQVVHLRADGSELWRGGAFATARAVSANPADGSCWVADGSGEIVQLAPDGSELLRVGGFDTPYSVSVNPVDSSCWVGDTFNHQVVHLDRYGHERWRGGSFDFIYSVAVNPTDGSCWVADGQLRDEAVRLAIVTPFPDVSYHYWALDEIAACAVAGIVGGYPDGSYQPTLPVSRDQMAVYVSRALVTPSGDAAIPDPTPPPTFSDVPADHWAYKWIEYAVSQNVVKGYSDGTYKPTEEVDRGQMSVFVARAIATPTAGVDLVNYTPPTTPTFPDVPTNFWAYKYVEYIAQPGIGVTKGYPDGDYHPEYICTRDQMAVYVARAFKLPQ